MKKNIVVLAVAALALAATVIPSLVYTAYATADSHYYVSPSGSGTCSAGSPCTIPKVAGTMRTTPYSAHGFTIDLAAGTYTNNAVDFWLPQMGRGSGAFFAMIGTPVASTLATGTATGTCTWGAPTTTAMATCTDSGAAWTADDLKHRWMRLGAVNSAYPDGTCGTWPVATNTTTAATLKIQTNSIKPTPAGCTGTLAYAVIEEGTVFTGVSSSALAVSGNNIIDPRRFPQYTAGYPDGGIANGLQSIYDLGDYMLAFRGTSPMRQTSIVVKWIKFAPAAAARPILLGEDTDITVSHAMFVGRTSDSIAIYAQGGNRVVIDSSYHLANGAGTVTGPAVATRQGGELEFLSIRNSIGEQGNWFTVRGRQGWTESLSNSMITPNGPVYIYNEMPHARFQADYIADAGNCTFMFAGNDVGADFRTRWFPAGIDLSQVNWNGAPTDSSTQHWSIGGNGEQINVTGPSTISSHCNSVFKLDRGTNVQIQDNGDTYLADGTGTNYLAEYGYDAVNTYKTMAEVDAGASFGTGNRGLCGAQVNNPRAGCIKLGTP